MQIISLIEITIFCFIVLFQSPYLCDKSSWLFFRCLWNSHPNTGRPSWVIPWIRRMACTGFVTDREKSLGLALRLRKQQGCYLYSSTCQKRIWKVDILFKPLLHLFLSQSKMAVDRTTTKSFRCIQINRLDLKMSADVDKNLTTNGCDPSLIFDLWSSPQMGKVFECQ